LALSEPRDEDQVRGGRCVPNQVEVRQQKDPNEITTFRRCRQYRTVIQGDSAIIGSRASGATTSTITQDWDRPIDKTMGLPTVQMLSEAAKQVRRKEGKVTVKPLQPGCQSYSKIRRELDGRGLVLASPT